MKFETIKDNKKRIGITLGVIGVVAVIGITAFTLTRASYKQTQRVPLIKGSISYNKSDLEIVAIKLQQSDGTYTDATEIPSVGYKLNENVSKSYCKVGDTTNKVDYKYDSGKWYINTANKGSKCYLTFDISLAGMILANNGGADAIKAKGNPDFSKTATTDEGMYAMEDDDGVSYYFRGTPTNNYIKFGKHASNYSDSTKAGKDMYWRIVRINGDGSIRLIYDGSTYHSNGTSNSDSIAVMSQFNSTYGDNSYVGYTYRIGSKRGLGTSSIAKAEIDKWYISSGLSNYASYLSDSGFCGDRTSTTTSGGVPNNTEGNGSTFTYYGAYYRLVTKKDPTLKCATINYGSGETGNIVDLYTVDFKKGNGELTYPIGMITADEVLLGGGGSIRTNFFLSCEQEYFTMSPSYSLEIDATIFSFNFYFDISETVNNKIGIRPVINIDPTKINNVTIDSQGVYVIS